MKHSIRFWLAGLAMMVAACGGGSPAARNGPLAPTGPIDVTGFWTEVPTAHVTFRLQQSGNTVTGVSDFFNDANSVFGVYSGDGSVTGTITGNALRLTTTYSNLTSGGTVIAGCVETITDTLTVTIGAGNSTMTGTFTQVDTCNGAVVFTKSGNSNFTRR